jgi:UDP-3-O-[3-hydroxymyristoyl] glucosamine N-acyltransferase
VPTTTVPPTTNPTPPASAPQAPAPTTGGVSLPAGVSINTGMVAALLKADLVGRPDLPITGGGTLESANPGDLTFIRDSKYAAMWASSRASAAIVTRGINVPGHDPAQRALLFVPDADLALITILGKLQPPDQPAPAGIHPTAIVDPTATIAPTAHVGPLCIIGAGCTIADHAVLRARVTLGAGVRVGERCTLHPGVVCYDRVQLGRHVIIHANSVIGADGFGYRPDPSGKGLVKIPHAGSVQIHDHVEIGASTTVDRGKMGDTIIGAGTKLDNQVQIAHNVRVGRGCAIAAQTGVAGSVIIGDGVLMGGHCGIADNIRIGHGARLGGFAAVMDGIPDGSTFMGYPAVPSRDFFRQISAVQRLAGTRRRDRR